jgi:hypothetical protein
MGLIYQATRHRSREGNDADTKKSGLLDQLLKPAGYDVVRASLFSFFETTGASERGYFINPNRSLFLMSQRSCVSPRCIVLS